MIIEFPKKYSVKRSPARNFFAFNVQVPKEYEAEAVTLLRQQPWAESVYGSPGPISGSILVFVSLAYEISEAQAIDALSRLCESILSPQVEMDADLAGELEDLV